MSYLALYRKYRPTIFEEVIGQNHITKTLSHQVETGAISHAYLFTGTRGTGKTSCAKIFAKADLQAVSDSFYNSHKDALSSESLSSVEKAIARFNATGCAIFSDYPINEKKLNNCIETLSGREFRVINFHNIQHNEDLFDYGFEKG